MSDKATKESLSNLSSNSIIEIFTIDTTDLEENYLQQSPINERIINLTNSRGFGYDYVMVGGVKFVCCPCELSDSTKGIDGAQSSRPKFSVTNHAAYASYIIQNTKNLAGAKFYRRKIFVENIDSASFENIPYWNNPSPQRYIHEESWIINRVLNENHTQVDLELVSPIDFENIKVPKRRMFSAYCDFEYRNSTGCSFGVAGFGDGKPKTDDKNQPLSVYGIGAVVDKGLWSVSGVSYAKGDYIYMQSRTRLNESLSDYKKFFYTCISGHSSSNSSLPYVDKTHWIPDTCSKTVQSCALRHPQNALRFGGFPGIINKRYSN